MAIGYACLIYGNSKFKLRSCTLKTATDEKLYSLIEQNLKVLSDMIDYNISNKITLFRISSDIVPFGSHPVNNLDWSRLFKDELAAIGKKIVQNEIRVSMHPGQYTVLNSTREDVVKNAVRDLEYHSAFLDSLGVDSSHKIILHIGGVYGDKIAAVERFKSNYRELPSSIKSRLIIENDEKSYNISDVISIGEELSIPVVFDNLHHSINPPDESGCEGYWICRAENTWSDIDGVQKIHYSQQREGGKPGSHSQSIKLDDFLEFYSILESPIPDIMLEVKDKNLSAIKCNNCVYGADACMIQREWARYKYLVLYHCHASYLKIRTMFRENERISPMQFYSLVEDALSKEPSTGSMANAFSHIWGYFKDISTESEQSTYKFNLESFEAGKIDSLKFKKFLYRLAKKYDVDYLLDSYFFVDIS